MDIRIKWKIPKGSKNKCYMLWYIFISNIILAQNREDFNESTTYKYVGKVKGTSTEWCCTRGLTSVGSHYYAVNGEGRKPSQHPERAVAMTVAQRLLLGVYSLV